MADRREVDIAVISDVHLGTPQCRAQMVWDYLKSIKPKTLIINGDLCDLGHYWRNHWPREHLMVIRRILKLAANGTTVYFLVGNHDAPARRFHGSNLGNLHVLGRLELELEGGGRALIVHGDCFDGAVSCPGWLYRIGGWSYERIMGACNVLNTFRGWFGAKPISIAMMIKNNVGMAQRYIERFRNAALDAARRGNFTHVITGHIHQPHLETMEDGVVYLNSGDWVEHCTALECRNGEWTLHEHELTDHELTEDEEADTGVNLEDTLRIINSAA